MRKYKDEHRACPLHRSRAAAVPLRRPNPGAIEHVAGKRSRDLWGFGGFSRIAPNMRESIQQNIFSAFPKKTVKRIAESADYIRKCISYSSAARASFQGIIWKIGKIPGKNFLRFLASIGYFAKVGREFRRDLS